MCTSSKGKMAPPACASDLVPITREVLRQFYSQHPLVRRQAAACRRLAHATIPPTRAASSLPLLLLQDPVPADEQAVLLGRVNKAVDTLLAIRPSSKVPERVGFETPMR